MRLQQSVVTDEESMMTAAKICIAAFPDLLRLLDDVDNDNLDAGQKRKKVCIFTMSSIFISQPDRFYNPIHLISLSHTIISRRHQAAALLTKSSVEAERKWGKVRVWGGAVEKSCNSRQLGAVFL